MAYAVMACIGMGTDGEGAEDVHMYVLYTYGLIWLWPSYGLCSCGPI